MANEEDNIWLRKQSTEYLEKRLKHYNETASHNPVRALIPSIEKILNERKQPTWDRVVSHLVETGQVVKGEITLSLSSAATIKLNTYNGDVTLIRKDYCSIESLDQLLSEYNLPLSGWKSQQ